MPSFERTRQEIQDLKITDYQNDLRHVMLYAYGSPECMEFAGKDEFDAPHPPETFYKELGRRAADFAAMHPEDAPSTLASLFRFMTALSIQRARTNRAAWREAPCTVDLTEPLR